MSETDSDLLRAAQLARRQDLEQVSSQSLCLDAMAGGRDGGSGLIKHGGAGGAGKFPN